MTTAAFEPRRVLLVVGGGIAAYKTCELIRRLREHEVAVRVILTRGGREFVTPLTLASLAGDRVYEDLFSLTDEAEMGHIRLSREADLVVVAPATADLMAKMAHGHADDLATTALLATDKPVLVAPAMNPLMWDHPATHRNVARLREDGLAFVGPEGGDMACGEVGTGRMAEPAAILDAVLARLPPVQGGRLAGRRVVVTSGPTHEPLDPVRFLANRSSGRQGHAIAAAFARAGAEVTLVTGPVTLPPPAGVEVRAVETAREMAAAVDAALPAEVAVCAAAVADWRPVETRTAKLKKSAAAAPVIELAENPDILTRLSEPGPRRPRLVVGFAAETEDVERHARAKLAKKGCDWLLANDVSPAAGTFGGARNRVVLFTRDGGGEPWPELAKTELADRLVARVADALATEPAAAAVAD